MGTPKAGAIMTFVPVGVDVYDPRIPFREGAEVMVVQPLGYPPIGFLGQCYVRDGASRQRMVLVDSLQPARTGETEAAGIVHLYSEGAKFRS